MNEDNKNRESSEGHEVDRIIADYGRSPSQPEKQKIAETIAGERARFIALEAARNRAGERRDRDDDRGR